MAKANDGGNFGDLSDFAELPITNVGHKTRLLELDEPFLADDHYWDSPEDEFETEKTAIVLKDDDIEEIEFFVD